MNRFRELRLQHGYSQKQLKELYNKKYDRAYSAGAMSLIESGKRMPELGALLDFADFYGVSLDYLLGRDMRYEDGNVEKEYKQGRKWHLSEHLREIVSGISWRSESESAENKKDTEKAVSYRMTEYEENLNMLKCLLQQSIILAKRVEKNKNSWYRY